MLADMFVITVCAVICGADNWKAVSTFGKAKRKWFKTFLGLPHGIPSHYTFNRVFAALRPESLDRCFSEWMQALGRGEKGLVAIDGKTLRGSFDRAGRKAAIHMVSAWASANDLVLGQLATDAKSNEITAIPKLLEILDISGSLVTIGAMGCQTEIARRFAEAVRSHWSIENNLHGQLDVTFQEDQCRIRKGHADANLSMLRRTALSMLKNEPTLQVGIKNKRLTAGWDETYLEKVLFVQ